MNRESFIEYLINCGCIVIRKDNAGYYVIRNVINSKMSGVPAGDRLRAATICRICRTLDVKIPDEAKSAEEIVDIAHNNHSKHRKN